MFLISVVSLPTLVMIQQNTQTKELIEVILEESHKFSLIQELKPESLGLIQGDSGWF